MTSRPVFCKCRDTYCKRMKRIFIETYPFRITDTDIWPNKISFCIHECCVNLNRLPSPYMVMYRARNLLNAYPIKTGRI